MAQVCLEEFQVDLIEGEPVQEHEVYLNESSEATTLVDLSLINGLTSEIDCGEVGYLIANETQFFMSIDAEGVV